ncbi:GNAT family N-acetyltransferase [Pseudomonas sp. C11]|uniref:GNAT family N-acetyltransferase n=1 Tax=Pseudomonas sp. C11 TaxID=3075550 RepID=UPI002AFFB720|nr:GNAT family N-acetyltransferase [Pseudomonas sp. C11]
MFTLSHLSSPPPESLTNQVLQMVVDNFGDISSMPLLPSNPLYPLYQYVIGYEVHLYLQAMNDEAEGPVQLLLALDDEDPARVLGFALYLPSPDDTAACTLPYLAVQAEYRGKGIGRALLQRVLMHRPHLELACVASKVPLFETLGLQVMAAQGSQVLMSSRDYRSNGMVAITDLKPVFASTEVRQIHAYLLKQHGQRAMQQAEKQRDAHLDALAIDAKQLVDERLPSRALH